MDRVKLIGGEDQDAVLVTGGQTFKLTKAETSNTLLLMPPEGTHCGREDGTGCPPEAGSANGPDREMGGSGAAGGGGFEAVAAIGFQFEVGVFHAVFLRLWLRCRCWRGRVCFACSAYILLGLPC